jgi:hypothetical protein
MAGQKLPCHSSSILLAAIDGEVHGPHVVGANAAGQTIKGRWATQPARFHQRDSASQHQAVAYI